MLSADWEACATRLANGNTFDEFLAEINAIKRTKNTSASDACVVVGRDTRPSGILLTDIIKTVCEAVGCKFVDCGVVTTPQLHYIVCAVNDPSHGTPTVDGYNEKMASAFNSSVGKATSTVYIDCANGVGALALEKLTPLLKNISIILHNTNTTDEVVLNHDCGADYVKMGQCSPPSNTINDGEMWASLDGDADRIVFYYSENKTFKLLDGF